MRWLTASKRGPDAEPLTPPPPHPPFSRPSPRSEFLADEDPTGALFWRYIDAATSSSVPLSADLLSPLRLAKPLLAPLTYDVLRVGLAARSYSPAVELQRQLAAVSPGLHACGADAAVWAEVSSAVRPGVRIVCGGGAGAAAGLEAALAAASGDATSEGAGYSVHPASPSTLQTWSWDHVYPASSPELTLAAESAPLVVLYADLGSAGRTEVGALHASLRSLAAQGKCKGVLRHWFPTPSSPSSGGGASLDGGVTWVSGYGVGLDVKSMEYKVIDDRANASSSSASTTVDATVAATGSTSSAPASDEAAMARLSALFSHDLTLGPHLGPDPFSRLAAADGPLHTGSWGVGAGSGGNASSAFGVGGVDWARLMQGRSAKEQAALEKARARVEATYGGGAAATGHGGLRASSALLSDRKIQTYEAEDLGLQAASYVMQAAEREAAAREALGPGGERSVPGADPLETLVTVASNFPSMAPFLSRLPVSEGIRAESERNQQLIQAGTSFVTVNGITLDPTAPTFNLFSLFNVLRSEAHVVAQLDTLPLSVADKRRVQALAVPGAAAAAQGEEGGEGAGGGAAADGSADGAAGGKSSIMRVDLIVEPRDAHVGGPDAPFPLNHSILTFLNDVETDPVFASWPSELRSLLTPSWQLHQIRRNLYTAILVLDLSASGGFRALQTALQFVSMRIPVRFGIAFLPAASPGEAAAAVAFDGHPLPVSENLNVLASARDFALVHAAALLHHGPEVAKTLVRQWVSVFRTDMEARAAEAAGGAEQGGGAAPNVPDGFLTVEQVVDSYAATIQSITGAWTTGAFRSEAMGALADAGGHYRSAVASVVRWVRRTGLPAPCMALNGRPAPGLNVQNDLMTMLGSEMQVLQTAVFTGKIDDSVAPSVYHGLLGRATRLSVTQARAARKAAAAAGAGNSISGGGSGGGAAAAAAAAPTYAIPGTGLIVPRWHPAVFAEEADQAFLPLSAPEAKPLLASAAFIHAPGTVDDVKPVTLTLVDDLNTPHGLFTAASLLTYVRQPPTPGAAPAPTGEVEAAEHDRVSHHQHSCIVTDGLAESDCPAAPAASRAEIARALRVGLLHVPALLLPPGAGSGSSSAGGVGGGAARFRKPSASRANVTVGDAVALAAALITGRRPDLISVRADEQGPLIAGIVDVARAALRARSSTADLAELGCTGCHVDAVAGFFTRLAMWLGSQGPSVPVKARVADKLLTLLAAALGVPASSSSSSSSDESSVSAAAVALLPVLADLRAAADVARRIVPASVPEARSVVTDAGGSSMSVRALAANGRVLSLVAPAGDAETSLGDRACVAGTFAAPPSDSTSSLGSCVTPDDAAVLVIHERMHRGSAVTRLLSDVSFPGADPDDLTAEWMSGVVMSAASAVGASLSVQSGNAGGRASGRIALRTNLFAATHTSFTSYPRRARPAQAAGATGAAGAGTGDDSEEEGSSSASSSSSGPAESVGLFVTAIIDPASEDAQRYAPLLLMLRDRLGATVRVHLNPGRGFSDLPVKSFFRYVLPPEIGLPEDLGTPDLPASAKTALWHPRAVFAWLPPSLTLTLKLYVPEPWNTQAVRAVHDTDNLRPTASLADTVDVDYAVKDLLAAGQCMDLTGGGINFPNGLQLVLAPRAAAAGAAGAADSSPSSPATVSDTLVMQNLGYWQLKAQPGVWSVSLAAGRASDLYDIVIPAPVAGARASSSSSGLVGLGGSGGASLVDLASGRAPVATLPSLDVAVRDFTGPITQLLVRKKPGREGESLLSQMGAAAASPGGDGKGGSDGLLSSISNLFGGASSSGALPGEEIHADGRPIVHVFSLASGHLYERFLKIMLLAATKRTPGAHLHFWLVENFLSPGFKDFVPVLAKKYGFDISFVTYKWPNWLRQQSEKQRIIWGYKILFLDVLFPLNVSKIIYIDADQVVRSDLLELWRHDLQGAPYAYTPFCTSRAETLGYQFWRDGYWKDHLQGKPYHISALYVVDLAHFRRAAVGDQLRAVYDQLSRDPNSLSNLDQDLPNYAQNMIPIHSLPQVSRGGERVGDWLLSPALPCPHLTPFPPPHPPPPPPSQEWLWCESWCSDASKGAAKTIDLCNNPRYKEPKLDMARRVINGTLFPESWDALDNEVRQTEGDWGEGKPVVPVPLPTPYPPTPTPKPKKGAKANKGEL